MGILSELLVGGLFLSLLASDNDAVQMPKGEWKDTVGVSIHKEVSRNITEYNRVVSDCKDTLSRVKTEAELKTLEVDFNSKQNDLEWQRQQINNVDINYIIDHVNQILRG